MNLTEYISNHFKIEKKLVDFVYECENDVKDVFHRFEEVAQVNPVSYTHLDVYKRQCKGRRAVTRCR